MATAKTGKRVSRSPRAAGRTSVGHGTVITIGGHEDKEGEKRILRDIAARVGSGRLVVCTVASSIPDEMWETYEPLFRNLGVHHVGHLDIRVREDALEEKSVRVLDNATVVFFTGGDQLKVTSQIGDTPVYYRLHEIYEDGGTLAGTSAGASVMSESMIVSGEGDETHRIGSELLMAPGLGMIPGVLIDQHFAERGRIGRLLGAVTQNPRIVGLGIDEDTAAIFSRQRFSVLGSGAVYVLDGRKVSYSNMANRDESHTLSAFNVTLHLLSEGDMFELKKRCPRTHLARVLDKAELGPGRKDREGPDSRD
jgi:cyanophycinase